MNPIQLLMITVVDGDLSVPFRYLSKKLGSY